MSFWDACRALNAALARQRREYRYDKFMREHYPKLWTSVSLLALLFLNLNPDAVLAESPWTLPDSEAAVRRMDVEAFATTLDSHLLFRLSAIPEAQTRPSEALRKVSATMLRAVPETELDEAIEKVSRSITAGQKRERDWNALAQMILIRQLAYVLEAVYQAQSNNYESSSKSLGLAHNEWDRCVSETLSIAMNGRVAKPFRKHIEDRYPVASDIRRLVNLPLALMSCQKRTKDARQFAASVRLTAFQGSGESEHDDGIRFRDLEVSCWRERAFSQWIVLRRWNEDNITNEFAEFLNSSKNLYASLSLAYKKLDKLEDLVRGTSLPVEKLPRSFDKWRVDFNRDGIIDSSEARDFRLAFELEFPRSAMAAIREKLRELEAQRSQSSLTDESMAKASQTNFGRNEPGRELFYEFRDGKKLANGKTWELNRKISGLLDASPSRAE